MSAIVINLEANPAWDAVYTNQHVRCLACRTVFPGDYRVEVDPQTGLCRECGGMETL